MAGVGAIGGDPLTTLHRMLTGRVGGTGHTCGPIIQPVPVTQQVQPGATSDIDVAERCCQSKRRGGQRRADDRRAPDLVGVDLFGGEQVEDGISLTQTEIDEQGTGIGVRILRQYTTARG